MSSTATAAASPPSTPRARQLTLDLGGEQVTLGPGYLDDRTVHGDPTLQHGYAMTVHVAQGLTVDHAFVLAGPGLDRELGYTALSRGRETNHLYAARDAETARVEYAPTDPHRSDPIARLAAQLADELGRHARDRHRAEPTSGARCSPTREREHRQVVAERRAAETSRGRWLPHRRARARSSSATTETQLARRVETLRRQQAEQRHGARPFVEDRDDHTQYREMARRIAERRLERELGRARRSHEDEVSNDEPARRRTAATRRRSGHRAAEPPAARGKLDGGPLPLMTAQEVAELLRVPRSTVYELARNRRIPFLKVGRRTLFAQQTLLDWIAAQTVQPRR